MNKRRIVITGGPATGKTAIVDELQSQGYHCYEEVIRKLTAAAQDAGDITEVHSNPIALVSDALNFNEHLIQLRLQDYNDASNKINFFDRGTPDVLAYMTYFNQTIPRHFIKICASFQYDQVFILPPWQEIFIDDEERFETFEQATAIFHQLQETYTSFGYATIEVPFGSIKERTDFLLSEIEV